MPETLTDRVLEKIPADLKEVTSAILERERIQKECPLLLFKPYDDYQKKVLTSEKRRIAVLGPNRHGKTTIGIIRGLCHALGFYPDYFPSHMRFKPPTRGRIIISEYKEHGAVLVDKIKQWCPAASIKKFYKNPLGYCVGVEFVNGSYVSILTHEQDTRSHEGWNGHWAWFDEPAPKEKFVATLRGLVDFNGQVWFTLTPISEPWLADEIYEENPGLWDVVDLQLYANPYISKEALDEFFASVPPDQLQARKFGKFIHLAGAVYPNFSPQRHIIPKQSLPDSWPRFLVCDPHDRRPFALAWFAVDPTDRIWFYDEYPDSMFHKITNTNLKIDDFATIIRNKEGRSIIVRRIIDRRYGPRRSVLEGKSIIDSFAEFGLYFDTSYDDAQGGVESGHIAVKEYLGSETQEPKVFFMDNCKNLIYAMTHYVYDEKTGKPREEVKDFADLVRYGIKDNPQFSFWHNTPTRTTQRRGVSGYGE